MEDIVKSIKSKNIYIIGDVNIDIKSGNNDRNSNSYLNLTSELGFLPGHTYPTRLNNCLDHVMVNAILKTSVIVINSSVTDHESILVNVSTESKRTKYSPSIIEKIDFCEAIKCVESTDFTFMTSKQDAESLATRFVDILSTAIKTNTKRVQIPRRKKSIKPWITPGLLRCIRNRDKLHLNLKRDPHNEVLKITYKRYRNFCCSLLRRLKCEHDKFLLKSANSSKETWNAIKSITNTTCKKSPADELLTKHNNMNAVEEINRYFSNIGKELAEKIVGNNNTNYKNNVPNSSNSFVLIPPDETEVNFLISSLKNDCATGWDSIPARFLKMVRHVIVPPLTALFQTCFEEGCFPKVFKRSLITPVHKNGARDDKTNYRPISVLTALSKILEKLLNKRLIQFLNRYNLLSSSQFGFRTGMSTEDAVSSLVDHVTEKLDSKQKCLGVFLDLAKAFDTVSIPILVDKLERIGIRGAALSIFKDFLSGRVQRVKINNNISSDANVIFGVPQGSVLGPSLFLLYINDLCNMNLTKNKIFTYADDTALIFYGDTWTEVHKNAETGLQKVAQWLKDNLLTLNISKTSFLQFQTVNSHVEDINIKIHTCIEKSINCTCTNITKSETVKYLGVQLDCKLSWLPHIEMTTSRTRKLIWTFKTLRYAADFETLRTIYFALAQSVISYCVCVWGGACKSYLIQLERAQRSLLKVMTFRPYRYPTILLYKKCELLTIRQLFVYNIIIKQHADTPFDPKICRNKRRIPNVLPTVNFRTTLARRQRSYLSTFLYNKINKKLNFYPLSLRECKSITKTWLMTLNYCETEDLFN